MQPQISTFVMQHATQGEPAYLLPETVTDDMRCVGPWRIEVETPTGRRLTLATAESDTELISIAMMNNFRLIDGETGELLVDDRILNPAMLARI